MLESIVCKFGGDPTTCVGEEAICAKVYKRTDRQTDDGRLAIALAHNKLKMENVPYRNFSVSFRECCLSFTLRE